MAKDPKDEFLKNLLASAKAQKDLNNSIGAYAEAIRNVGEIQESIKYAEEQRKLLQDDLNALKKEEEELNKKLQNSTQGLTNAERKRLANLGKLINAQEDIVNELEKQEDSLRAQNEQYIQQIKSVNKINLLVSSVGKGLGKMPELIKKGFGALDGSGIFKVDKEIRLAGRSLNVSSKNSDAFGLSLNKAAKSTSMMGVHTEDLAKAQQSYSEEIGRSVVLTEQGLIAMAKMAEGTGLGVEGASAMAAEMDKFNLSVESSADYVEETVKLAAKMGVNSDKAIKNLQTNLKLAQKFNFKGGVKGVTEMANEAARLKLDMEGLAGLADKVFRPEGAVEMAAQLQVMGGEFAKLGDPFQLMFKARNDFAGFAKDIANATVEFVSFNDETGETVLKGGLAADRMREIAKITGIGVEELTKMAGAQKRLQKFGALIPSVVSNQEDRDLIASMAQMEGGQAIIKLEGGEKFNIKELSKVNLDAIRSNKEGLEKRAKDVQTFDDNLNNFIKTLKSTLLPVVQSLNETFGKGLQSFIKKLNDKGVFQKMESFMTGVGNVIEMVYDVFGVGGLLASWGVLKAATWVAHGFSLAKGFMMGTRGMRESYGGPQNMPGSPNSVGSGKNFKNLRKASKMGKFAKGGVGIGAGVLSAGLSGYDEYTANQEAGMDSGQNVGRTALRAGASGGGAWGGAALGASIGTAVFPGVGTAIGGLIGGIAGGLAGDKLGDAGGDLIFSGNKGKNTIDLNDGIINFNPNDKFMSVGQNAMIAGTNTNGNKKLAEAVSGVNPNNSSGEVKHKFEDLNINISLNSDTSWLNRIGSDIANDRKFVRELTVKIQEEIRMAIGGGKLNPNPI